MFILHINMILHIFLLRISILGGVFVCLFFCYKNGDSLTYFLSQRSYLSLWPRCNLKSIMIFCDFLDFGSQFLDAFIPTPAIH